MIDDDELKDAVSDLFNDEEAFGEIIQGYAPRSGQIAMAELVASAITDGATLVCEAGTGIGKTMAYLVPALVSDARVIVSTGTRALQDQLYHRDLPAAAAITSRTVHSAMLKGRANYLCLHRLDQARGGLGLSRLEAHQLELVNSWRRRTSTGDIAELDSISEESSLWPQVTSTADNCMGNQCPDYTDCFVVKARRTAAAAQVVVVNHHLLMAEFVLKEDGFGELLAGADVVVCDEAHQLPDIASQFFGMAVSSRQILDMLRDTAAAYRAEAPDTPGLERLLVTCEQALNHFREVLSFGSERQVWDAVRHLGEVMPGLEALLTQLNDLGRQLEGIAERGPAMQQCAERARRLSVGLATFAAEADPAWIRTVDLSRLGWILRATPLDVGQQFRAGRGALATCWIFTSATIAVGNDLGFFCQRLGLEDPALRLAAFASPFDYAANALLFLPDIHHEPSHPGFMDEVLALAVPVLQASRGRAFFLFTSYRALHYARDHLLQMLPTGYTLFVQGSRPKQVLLDEFRECPHAVLLGTTSFWEGVDVRGEALSCVIIDKLPFEAPDDPVLKARLARIAAEGGNGFMDYQVPAAILTLKQGAGRLIRDVTDKGVLMICDPRLHRRRYGRRFVEALPPMRQTSEVDEVVEFLHRL